MFSCQQEDIEQREIEVFEPDPSLNIKNSEESNASISIDGNTYYAGFGYNPVVDQSFPMAMYSSDIYESTHISNPLSVSIKIIKTNKQLEVFVKNGQSRVYNNEVFISNGGNINDFENSITISENTTTIVARINIERYKYITDGLPFFNTEAQQLVEDRKISQFINTYGPMYIESQVLGGHVYYFYTYRDSNFESNVVSEYEYKIKSYIQKFFGIHSGLNLTIEERERIENTLLSQGIYSSVPGFEPRIVRNTTQFENEISRLQSYLNSHPEKASTVQLKLKPYSYMINLPALRDVFNEQSKCFLDAEKWKLIQADILFIKNNTTNSILRRDSNIAIEEINVQVQKSENCDDSITPSDQQYNSLKQRYTNEIDS